MSYCIIGMKRTRSSVLSISIANFHNSDNYFGMYDGITPSLKDQIRFKKLSLPEKNKAKLDFFKSEIKKLTLEVFDRPNTVIKLFPRYMIYHDRPYVENHTKSVLPNNLDDLLIIKEIEEYFQISKFNKIYYLDRDVTDAVASYCYGIFIKKFQFKTVEEVTYYNKICKPVAIDLTSPWIDFCIFEYMLQNQIKLYLDKNKLEYTLLSYDEIPKHCDLYYSGTQENNYKYPEFNYKKIIANYTELQDYIRGFIEKKQSYVSNNIVFQ